MKELSDLSIGIIREAQEKCNREIKTIGGWKQYWIDFADKYNISRRDALKIAQDRF